MVRQDLLREFGISDGGDPRRRVTWTSFLDVGCHWQAILVSLLCHNDSGLPTTCDLSEYCVVALTGDRPGHGARPGHRSGGVLPGGLGIISGTMVRVTAEGYTIVMKAISHNAVREFTKAIDCAPRGARSNWFLKVQVRNHSISPWGSRDRPVQRRQPGPACHVLADAFLIDFWFPGQAWSPAPPRLPDPCIP